MKKGINKQVFTIVILLALLALVAVYFLGYKKYVDQAALIVDGNTALQKEVDNLKQYYINEAQYKADMVPMAEEIHTIMDKYPSDIKEEDVIMHAVQTQLGATIDYQSINIGSKEVLKTVAQDIVVATAQEDMQSEVAFVERIGTYVNELKYDALKSQVQAVFDSKYNLGIKSISYSKADEFGLLAGSMDLAFYSMNGNNKEYTAPDMMPYLNGAANIFGVLILDIEDVIEGIEGTDDGYEVGGDEEGTEEGENTEGGEDAEGNETTEGDETTEQ